MPDGIKEVLSPLRLFQYVTVRAFCGAGTAFILCMVMAPWTIRYLKRLKVGQYERKEYVGQLYELHAGKEGTPTMGGILIIFSVLISVLLWGQVDSYLLWLAILTFVYMGLIGFWDDYLKMVRKNSDGLRARNKFALEVLFGIVMFISLVSVPETHEKVLQLMVPFIKEPVIHDMGILAGCLFMCGVIVGTTNAVNLTDGLDGLAIGCTGSVAMGYMIMSYVAGHAIFAHYLLIPYIRGAGELAIFCGCILGASLGFLWYNCHPASVFMGDTGSLALGGAIGVVAVLIKQELVLLIMGGVFVIEALSVILQVMSFRLTGKRIFAMSPLHHHFELRNWSETQVVVRFWIISIICAILGVLTLKIR
jgi:phospho-N-acetylmuramoyl-pentapeptide-transferase